jgi:hypothetical protein
VLKDAPEKIVAINTDLGEPGTFKDCEIRVHALMNRRNERMARPLTLALALRASAGVTARWLNSCPCHCTELVSDQYILPVKLTKLVHVLAACSLPPCFRLIFVIRDRAGWILSD